MKLLATLKRPRAIRSHLIQKLTSNIGTFISPNILV